VYDDFNKMSTQAKSDVVKQGIETLDLVRLSYPFLIESSICIKDELAYNVMTYV